MREIYRSPEGKQRPFDRDEGRKESAKRRRFFSRVIKPAIQRELTDEELAEINIEITGSTANDAAIRGSDLDIVVTNPGPMKLSRFVDLFDRIKRFTEEVSGQNGRYRVDVWPEWRDDEEHR